jgi:hypothetical protein
MLHSWQGKSQFKERMSCFQSLDSCGLEVCLHKQQEFRARFCSARLQAGIANSQECPPEGGRYIEIFMRQSAGFSPFFAKLDSQTLLA